MVPRIGKGIGGRLLTVAFMASFLLLNTSGHVPMEARSTATSEIAAPTLTGPADGATLTNFGTTLTWNNPAGATQYHLQVVPAGNDGPGIDIHAGSPGTSLRVPPPPQWYGLLPDMTYTWRVRVSSAPVFAELGDPSWGAWSQRRFRTPKVSSGAITPAFPGNSGTVRVSTPVLQWANSRSDVYYYEVQVSKDSGFQVDPSKATAMVYWVLVHGGVNTAKNSYSIPAEFPLEPKATYFWRVRPRVQGDGAPVAWSQAFSFRTEADLLSFPPQGLSSRPVLAQYYAWYDESTWDPNLVSDTPRVRYNSDDSPAMARHAEEAHQAGIDAFSLSWLGPGNRTDSNLQRLLLSANNTGLWVTITFETDKPEFGSQEAVVAGLKYLQQRYAGSPNWLRYDGRRVYLFWRPSDVPLQKDQDTLSAWRSIRDQVDPSRQDIWIAEGLDFSLLEIFDGQFGYSIAWSSDVRATLASWQRRVRAKEEQLRQPKIFMGTVMPGYDDTRLASDRPDAFARDREGGAFFAQTWDAAISAGSDWINITSFNEWIEGSQIEPSVTYGDLYLNIAKEWRDRYKASSQ